MVQAIDFAVRDSAGGLVRGAVGGETGSNFIQMGSGEEISLNLSRSSVVAYERAGSDLLITLTDGSTMKLAGFFAGAVENELYLSTNGEIIAVDLQGGEGTLFASYGATDSWDKYSVLDDLRFVDGDNFAQAVAVSDEPAGQGLFVPGLLGGGLGAGGIGAGLLGGGVLLGGGGGGGGGGRPAPTVDNPDRTETITSNTVNPDRVITGTGVAGDTVLVTIGTQTQTTTITPGGTWGVTFPGTNLPPDGNYDADVLVTPPGGTPIPLDGPNYIIDVTPPPVTLTQGFQSNGDVENLAEHANGTTLTGTSENGATVSVTVNNVTKTVLVGASGTWSVTYSATELPGGEYTKTAVIRATDPLGNVTTVNDSVVIDTIPNTITFDSVTADNTVNHTENGDGFTISGMGTANSSITMTLQGVTRTANVGGDGKWTLNWAAGVLTPGEYDATINATSTDAAGNIKTASHTFKVDTQTSVAFTGNVETDNTVNATERGDGVTLTGTAQPGSTVSVLWNGTTVPATVAGNGSWTANFPASALPTSMLPLATTAVVTATDVAGNTATANRVITIDTGTDVTIDTNQFGGDNIESKAEAANGIVLTGTAEAGAKVEVTFESSTRTVTADANGNWTASWTAGEVRAGQYDVNVTVIATDLAGNIDNTSHNVRIDTVVQPFTSNTVPTSGDKADTIVNRVEADAGLTVTGTVEAGSTVSVKLANGSSIPATVTGTTWTAIIPTSQIPSGESTVAMTATATDAVGNTSELTQQVQIDTVVRNFARTGGTIGGDGVLNASEVAAGLTLQGTVEANSSVVVRLANGASHTVPAGTNGQWSATFAAGELPTGEASTTATITATDRAGNVAVITETFAVDTVAPGAPDVITFERDFRPASSGVRGVGVTSSDDDLTFFKVGATGSATAIAATEAVNPDDATETNYSFGTARVPDGTYLVINTEDTAGNESSTLFIVNNTSSTTVDLTRAGLQGFDFSTIDLSVAPTASLTITEAQIHSLTGADKTLTIAGGADDSVTMTGAVDTLNNVTIDGQTYSIYTLGNQGATVLLDDDIQRFI